MATGEEAVAIHQRSDVCAVPAAGVVPAMQWQLVVARAVLEKFGGDSSARPSATSTATAGHRGALRRFPIDAGLRGNCDGSEPCWSDCRVAEIHHRTSLAGDGLTPARHGQRDRGEPAGDRRIFAEDGEDRRIEVIEALETHDGILSRGRSPHRGSGGAGGARLCFGGDPSASGFRGTSGSTVRPLLAGADVPKIAS